MTLGNRDEFFVEISGDFLAGGSAANEALEQGADQSWRRGVIQGRSSCDSTPFHSASSAAREARSAETPAGVTV